MTKSKPISQFIDDAEETNLVDGILNNIETPIIEKNIHETQKQEQRVMEENMERQIEDQQRLEQEYHQPQEQYEEQPQFNDQHDQRGQNNGYHNGPNNGYNNGYNGPNNGHNNGQNNGYNGPAPVQEPVPVEKSFLDKLLENLKPAIIVIILSSCVFSSMATKVIDGLLPNKEIFIKYNIWIVLLIKSLLSGIIFVISNLLL